MCPAGSAGLGGVSRGKPLQALPAAPLCSSLPSPALRSYPSLFNLCPNSPPAVPCDVSVLPQGRSAGGCSGEGEGLGSPSWHFPKCWLRNAADAAQPRFPPSSEHPLSAEPARLSHPISPLPSNPVSLTLLVILSCVAYLPFQEERSSGLIIIMIMMITHLVMIEFTAQCLAALHWAHFGKYWKSWAGLVVLGWLPLPSEDCRAAPTPAWNCWCHQQLMLGWNGEQQHCPALSSRWIGTIRSSIRFSFLFSCCFVPGFFGEVLVEVLVRVRVSMEQVLGQPGSLGRFTGPVFP